MDDKRIAGILLAAGGSVRMGEPKQLLQVGGMTLIQRAAATMLEAQVRPTIVVVGREATQMRTALTGLGVIIIENTDWERGMGTSIRVGIQALQDIAPDIEGALLSVCDQPLVGVNHLQKLVDTWQESGAGLASASYGGCVGTPAIFSASYFSSLLALDDHAGAKGLLKSAAPVELVTVPMNEAATDVDTPADWHHFRQLFTARSRTA